MWRHEGIDQRTWARHSWLNSLQTFLLMLFLGGYLLLLGWMLWGGATAFWLPLCGVLLLMPTSSPRMLLRLYRARELPFAEAPGLYRLAAKLAERAGLERTPVLYWLPLRQANALAMGSRTAPVVALSEGLLQLLDERQLAGVLAHEIAHLRNGDLRAMRLAEMLVRLTGVLSFTGQILLLVQLPMVLFGQAQVNWMPLLLLVLAPQAVSLAQLGLSRVREYHADLGAVALTNDPEGLAAALETIERREVGLLQRLLGSYAAPGWLRTHPPTRERVRRLLELSRPRHIRPLSEAFSLAQVNEAMDRLRSGQRRYRIVLTR